MQPELPRNPPGRSPCHGHPAGGPGDSGDSGPEEDGWQVDGRAMLGIENDCCDAARPYFAAHHERRESCALRQQAQQRPLAGKRPESPHHDPTAPSDSSGLTI
ncbi:uncharacterized protein TrAtP1_011200 [Trichoderma atroviride]|uniref:uncharacterized protein n=1 Tax=Hypocrea atroviridis TaxID=63577 RepID=UPI003330172C|nr:hypothetical protein TrAtP1_011200 [Trichoderma atroviride]